MSGFIFLLTIYILDSLYTSDTSQLYLYTTLIHRIIPRMRALAYLYLFMISANGPPTMIDFVRSKKFSSSSTTTRRSESLALVKTSMILSNDSNSKIAMP